jgi:hypothetical protein
MVRSFLFKYKEIIMIKPLFQLRSEFVHQLSAEKYLKYLSALFKVDEPVLKQMEEEFEEWKKTNSEDKEN